MRRTEYPVWACDHSHVGVQFTFITTAQVVASICTQPTVWAAERHQWAAWRLSRPNSTEVLGLNRTMGNTYMDFGCSCIWCVDGNPHVLIG